MRDKNQERFGILPVYRVWGGSTIPLKHCGIGFKRETIYYQYIGRRAVLRFRSRERSSYLIVPASTGKAGNRVVLSTDYYYSVPHDSLLTIRRVE